MTIKTLAVLEDAGPKISIAELTSGTPLFEWTIPPPGGDPSPRHERITQLNLDDYQIARPFSRWSRSRRRESVANWQDGPTFTSAVDLERNGNASPQRNGSFRLLRRQKYRPLRPSQH